MDDKLIYFLYTVETLSFAKTASHFYISSTAVSKAIANLEHQTGLTLFNRHHNSIELTAQGRAFYENTKFIQADYNSAVKQSQQIQEASTTHLTIGFSSYYEAAIIVPLINQFKQKHRLNIKFTHRSIEQLQQGVLDGNLDLAFTFTHFDTSNSKLNTSVLFQSTYTVALSRYNHFANQDKVSLSDLTDLPCGYYSQYNSLIAKQLLVSEVGVDANRLKQYETYETLLASVATNQCFAFFPDLFNPRNLFPDIVTVPAAEFFNNYEIVVVTGNTDLPILQSLISYFQNQLSAYIETHFKNS